MTKFFKLTFLILFTSLMSFGQQLELLEPIRILALGDSYTIGESVDVDQRWPEQLKHSLEERFVIDDLKIIAKTGWRTDQLITAVTENNPKDFNFVTLLIGVNNQYQGKAISEMKKDFTCLLAESVSRAGGSKKRVLVLSIPDYAFTPFGQTTDHKKITKELDKYNSWQKAQTEKAGIAYVDLTEISRLGIESPELVAEDGLHPSGEQYKLWVEKILKEQFK